MLTDTSIKFLNSSNLNSPLLNTDWGALIRLYVYSGGYTTHTVTAPITTSSFTRITLLVDNARNIRVYVNGGEISLGNITLKNSFFNDVNQTVTLGDSNLQIKRFRLYNSQYTYINPI